MAKGVSAVAIDDETLASIQRLYFVEKWKVGTIARQLHVHHSTVERALDGCGVARDKQRQRRPSMLDPYETFIVDTLERYPDLTAARIHAMLKERGYPGGPDNVRHRLAYFRKRKPAEAFLRLRTLRGEQSQVDWAHFGKLPLGDSLRPLMAFVMVLSYSRHTYCKFYYSEALPNVVRGHVEAFGAFGGVARVVLYDNMKTVVLERRRDAIRFHPTALALATHYRFEPRPVAVARGNEKGRVERTIQYVRSSFFAGRTFTDIDDLNAQARQWCEGEAADRPCPGDRARTVREVFEDERSHLLALPDNPFPTEERVEVRIPKTPYARFDGNDYSVPHTHVRRTLVVLATLATVRISDGADIVATHPRTFERGQQIEDPSHIQALVEHKQAAREHRAKDRLHRAAPATDALFRTAGERQLHFGALTRGLVKLLDSHGAEALERAVTAALDRGAPTLGAVRQCIDEHRHARGEPPPLPIALPDDPRLKHLRVTPHRLADYDLPAGDDDHEARHNDNHNSDDSTSNDDDSNASE